MSRARVEQETEAARAALAEAEAAVARAIAAESSARAPLPSLQSALDAADLHLRVHTYWLAKMSPAQSKQKEGIGFRSFCLSRVLGALNPLLRENLRAFAMDSSGAERHSLSCRLNAALALEACGGAPPLEGRSEGQRRRAHLALFLALFELAQRRGTFAARFLFLDEAFDSLDQEGQQSVQRWIHRYALDDNVQEAEEAATSGNADAGADSAASSGPVFPSSAKSVFIITHSSYAHPSVSNGCLYVRLDAPTGTSEYRLESADGVQLQRPFVTVMGGAGAGAGADAESATEVASTTAAPAAVAVKRTRRVSTKKREKKSA